MSNLHQSSILAQNGDEAGHNGLPIPAHGSATFLDANDADERQMIETMGRLRDLGIGRIFPLPQVIVCGAQSSGKSSVLEAITEIPFPRNTQMCTRYVTKVTLAYSQYESVNITIEPGMNRTSDDKRRIRSFKEIVSQSQPKQGLRECMEKAHRAIFPGDEDQGEVTDDILAIEITGRSKRALQLIDLPGLIEYHQHQKVVDKIESMVKDYMAMPQSIILAIAPANNDLYNAKILKLCKDYDPRGERTLTIITKPDLSTDDDAKSLTDTVQGRNPSFKNFSWHVLRNRETDEVVKNTPSDERNRQETKFFSTTKPWSELKPCDHGIEPLREKLRQRYFAAAKKELLAMKGNLDRLLRHDKYASLSADRVPNDLKGVFKLAVDRLKAAVVKHAEGRYDYMTNCFPDGSPINLRSRVREQDELFCEGMATNDHIWMPPLDNYVYLSSQNILPTPPPEPSKLSAAVHSGHTDRDDHISAVGMKLHKTRGTELMRYYSPQAIDKLFWQMSDNWEEIAKRYVESVYNCCERYFEEAIRLQFARTEGNRRGANGKVPDGFPNAPFVAKRFLTEYVIPRLKEAHEDAKLELWRLEQDRRDHAKNHDKRFLVSQKDHRDGVQFRVSMGVQRNRHLLGKTNAPDAHSIEMGTLAEHRQQSSLDDYKNEKAEEFLHDAQSHYQIARDTYIMNVLTQVQERHFLRNIVSLIPDDLDLCQIQELVKEDDETSRKQAQLEQEFVNLNKARDTLDAWSKSI